MPGGTGCGIVSPSENSFGEPFNAAGGGVFGMLWDGTGIRMCKSTFLIFYSNSLLVLKVWDGGKREARIDSERESLEGVDKSTS